MIVGKVTGSVVSTRKNENLIGNKFMIIEPVASMRERPAVWWPSTISGPGSESTCW